jgi:beta propeller repeat protein
VGTRRRSFHPPLLIAVVATALIPLIAPPAMAAVSTPHISRITPAKVSAGTNGRITITGRGFGTRSLGDCVLFWRKTGVAKAKGKIITWSAGKIVCVVPEGTSSAPVVVRKQARSTRHDSNGYPIEITFGWHGYRLAAAARDYRINAAGGVGWAEMVNAAAATWSAAGAKLTLTPEATPTCTTTTYIIDDSHNDIFWSRTIPKGATSRTLGRTKSHPDKDVNGISPEFDIWLNDNKLWGDATADSLRFDVESVVLHELGHAIGFTDLYGAADRGKVMYGGMDPGTVRRNLTASETAGIRWIYGKSAPPSPPVVSAPIVVGSDSFWDAPDVSDSAVVWAGNYVEGGVLKGHGIVGYDLKQQTLVQIAVSSSGATLPAIEPAIWGDKVVWSRTDGFGFDLVGRALFPFCVDPGGQARPDIGGSIVVWEDFRSNTGIADIYACDLTTGREFPVCTDPRSQDSPAVAGNTVVWEDWRHGDHTDIYGFDLITNTEFPICIAAESQTNPKVSGNIAVWEDWRSGDIYPDVYGYDLSTKQTFLVAKGGLNPDASDGVVVWWSHTDFWGRGDIWGYSLAAKAKFPICVGDGYDNAFPSISGSNVAWVTDSWNDADNFLVSRATLSKSDFRVSSGPR